MFLHICSKATSLAYERILIKESKEKKKTLRFTKLKKRKPYFCCAIYFLIWGTVVLVIANKGTISVARKQEVAEIREWRQGRVNFIWKKMRRNGAEVDRENRGTRDQWRMKMQLDKLSWKNWNGKQRICVDEIDDVENFAAFRDEWTRWAREPIRNMSLRRMNGRGGKRGENSNHVRQKKWTTAVHMENANHNDATDLLVSATELFINEMMPRVQGETEVISYKHGFFIFKIKKKLNEFLWWRRFGKKLVQIYTRKQKISNFFSNFFKGEIYILPKNHWIIRVSFFQFCQVGGLAIIHKRKMSQFWLEVSERIRIFSGSRFFSGEFIV